MFAKQLGDAWGAETSPSGYDLVYARTIDADAPGILEYAQTIQAVGESLLDAISRARLTLAMTDAQRQMIDIQLARARQGLPPISTAQPAPPISSTTILLIVAALVAVYLATRKG